MSSHSELSINPAVKTIGVSTPVTVKLSNPHGVRRISAYMEQGGARYPLTDVKTPAHRLFWHRQQAAADPDLRRRQEQGAESEGRRRADRGGGRLQRFRRPAPIPPRPTSTWCWRRRALFPTTRSTTSIKAAWNCVMTPAGGSWNEAGVKVGKYTFRSFPLPGRPEQRFAMFAYPWDLPGRRDAAGLRAQRGRHGSHGANSGSSCSRRNSARAIFKSTTR